MMGHFLMILITGSKGFIGRNLVKRFKPDEVILLDKHNCFSELIFLPWHDVTHIYHLGAISDTTCMDISKLFTYNVEFTSLLMNRAIDYNIPITYASSASVYGNSVVYEYNPLNLYALSKLNIDLWVESNLDQFNNIVGLRFYNVYGKDEESKEDQSSAVYKFIQQAKNNGIIQIFEGSKKFYRDFIWVEDVIDCMLTPMPSGIYDVGTGEQTSFFELAADVAFKYQARMENISFPDHLKGKYQTYTIAQKHFPKKIFKTINDYLNLLDSSESQEEVHPNSLA